MKGWGGYAAGLDTERDRTGKYGLYTTWKGLRLMFHVNTLMPLALNCEQQVSRKSHIGNDVILIVYMDGTTPYNTATISSKQIHVIAVVQPVEPEDAPDDSTDRYYRLEVACKSGVPAFGRPIDTQPYKGNRRFRDLLLAKLVAGQKASNAAPAFLERLGRQRENLLRYMNEKFLGE